jgi:hypothetical protein
MSSLKAPQPEANNPAPGPLGKLYAATSLLVALIGLGLAFLPWGYGFVTVFLAAIGVILGGMGARHGAPHLGRWASRANMVPVLAYVAYMVSYLPEEDTSHTFQATIIEAGVLQDPSVFDEDVQAAGSIAGIRMQVAPCGHEFIIRVTGLPNSHLGLYVPTKPTRECLAGLQAGQTLDLGVVSTERLLTGEVKGYRIHQVGPCTLQDVDMGAIIKGTTCPSWF